MGAGDVVCPDLGGGQLGNTAAVTHQHSHWASLTRTKRCMGGALRWPLQDVRGGPLALGPSFSNPQHSLEILHPEGFPIVPDLSGVFLVDWVMPSGFSLDRIFFF